jgi:hypothetical protein
MQDEQNSMTKTNGNDIIGIVFVNVSISAGLRHSAHQVVEYFSGYAVCLRFSCLLFHYDLN